MRNTPETELEAEIHKILLTIPNIIDPSVPIGPDDSANVERETFGEAVVPEFEIVHGFLRLADHDHFLLFKLVNAEHAPLLDAVGPLLLATASPPS